MRSPVLLMLFVGVISGSPSTQSLKSFRICKNGHPHCAFAPGLYPYHQFAGRPLQDFVVLSDVLTPGPKLEHYQSFLSEVISQRPDTNAVAVWGDATGSADKSRVWGGFFTARTANVLGKPTPKDAQLIGLEIDVLNSSLPGVFPNDSKVGLQIVGFGHTNTNAIELLTEAPGGKFINGINVQPGAIAPEGTLFGVAPQKAKLRINLQDSQFDDAAILLSPNNRVTFRHSGQADASIWRDEIFEGHLVLSSGPSGLRITNAENTRNLLYIHPDGRIDYSSVVLRYYWPWIAGAGFLIVSLAAMVLCVLIRLRRLEATLYPRPAALGPWCFANACPVRPYPVPSSIPQQA